VSGPLLGCIADDFTGATDLAGVLVQAGHRTAVAVGTDGVGEAARGADAVVVALKTRTAPLHEAVASALEAHRHLAAAGCTRYWFKYCSTFDSTPQGNIGPVTDALLEATGSPYTVACPAFPANGRTVYQGHLFVGDRLLSESGMRDHPLTPMTDADLVRWLTPQTRHRVGLLPLQALRAGDAAARLAAVTAEGARIVVTDTVAEDDFPRIAHLTRDLPLLTGGSGLARALPPPSGGTAAGIDVADGPCVVLAGSVSPATLAQTAHARTRLPARKLSLAGLLDDPAGTAARAAAWAAHSAAGGPVLLYSADDRDEVTQAQRRFGAGTAAQAVEDGLAACARLLLDAGVRRLVVAGGETSGAVVAALGLHSLRIGPSVAPGVPWTAAHHRGHTVNLLLKSGNFGGEDLFTTAEDAL
jgi:3-dehydrotetronate 4-kinase